MSQNGKSAAPSGGTLAFPILMRVPDLRVAIQQPVTAAVAPEKTAIEPPVTEAAIPQPTASLEQAVTATNLLPTPLQPTVEEVTVPVASPEPAAEITPAKVSRHQRVQERQLRRETEAKQSKGSWWTSHFPIIVVGFLIALGTTLYLARQNRLAHSETTTGWDTAPAELAIEPGEPEIVPPVIEMANQPIEPPVSETLPAETVAEPSLGKQLPPLISVDELKPEAAETTAPEALTSEEAAGVNSDALTSDYPTTDAQPVVQERVATNPEDETPSYPDTNLPPLLR